MQYRQIAIKGGGKAFGQVAKRVSHALSGAKAWNDDKTADAFLKSTHNQRLFHGTLHAG